MANNYFNHSIYRVPDGIRAVADHINNVADEIAAGFDKLPAENELKQGRANYATDTGTANNYVITLSYTPTLTAGLAVSFQAANTNTGPSTLNVNGLGPKEIRSNSGTPMVAGQITAGQILELRYDGAAFRVMATDIPVAAIKQIYESNPNTNVFTDAEKAKLSGIEAGATADMTPAEIKTAYESNANTNAFTDGEKLKLSGIETGATADMTPVEIKTAYESNIDTNAFTDAEKAKLASVAAGANNYSHPSYIGDDIAINIGPLGNAAVISQITLSLNTDLQGHVTSASATTATRNITPANIGAIPASGGAVSGSLSFSDNKGISLGSTYGSPPIIYGDASGRLVMKSSQGLIRMVDSASAVKVEFNLSTGTGTAADWIATSDERLKSDIELIESPIERIKKIKGVTFYMKGRDGRKTGVIAQDVLSALPEAVVKGTDGYLAVSYGAMIGLVIEAIKEIEANMTRGAA